MICQVEEKPVIILLDAVKSSWGAMLWTCMTWFSLSLSLCTRFLDHADVQSGMDLYEYKFSHYSTDIAMIFVIGLVIRIVAFAFLELLYRDKRK